MIKCKCLLMPFMLSALTACGITEKKSSEDFRPPVCLDIENQVDTVNNESISPLVKNIRYVVLDDSIPLSSSFLKCREWNGGYVVSSGILQNRTGLLKFRADGSLEKVLLQLGNSSNEVNRIYDWHLDAVSNEIVVSQAGKMLVVGAGEPENVRVARPKNICLDVRPVGNGRYAYLPAQYNHPGKAGVPYLSVIDSTGAPVKHYSYDNDRNRTNGSDVRRYDGPVESFGLFSTSEGKVLFKDMYNDTLYVLSDTLSAYMVLRKGSDAPKPSYAYQPDKKARKIYVRNCMETENYALVVYYLQKNKINTALFEKSTGRLLVNASADISSGGREWQMIQNEAFVRYELPDGRTVMMGVVAACGNKLYGIFDPSDMAGIVPGVGNDSNPVLAILEL